MGKQTASEGPRVELEPDLRTTRRARLHDQQRATDDSQTSPGLPLHLPPLPLRPVAGLPSPTPRARRRTEADRSRAALPFLPARASSSAPLLPAHRPLSLAVFAPARPTPILPSRHKPSLPPPCSPSPPPNARRPSTRPPSSSSSSGRQPSTLQPVAPTRTSQARALASTSSAGCSAEAGEADPRATSGASRLELDRRFPFTPALARRAASLS